MHAGVVNHASGYIRNAYMPKAKRLRRHTIELARKIKVCGPFDDAQRGLGPIPF